MKVRYLRQAHHIQFQKFGLGRTSIYLVETGKMNPSLQTVEKIAEASDTSVRTLIDDRYPSFLFDPFIKSIQPLVAALNADARKLILKTLEALADGKSQP
jgi:transcriptional regulator with XRE-family HTH domain